ncbi:iron-containing alcohol dehydrogenase [Consotaella salsifontis]|uniref:Alcohol dehydrogenase 2 n=1 Tax=Consotaella salsifontis TaxID=1365950 RepID=A0A1T4T1J3_9HYPH|nr:iron-containing alcohol dehydrogenase [Consotaella salsifontis]SKA34364.1 Alcohol dehydrogenase, class IV [Consotaella salsifontis]
MYSVPFPGRVHVGAGSLGRLAEFVGPRKSVLAVVDGGVRGTAAIEQALDALRQQGSNVTLSGAVPPEPADHDIERLVAEVRTAGCDAVVGIGGGSVLDAAKLFAAMLAVPVTVDQLVAGAPVEQRLPLILVPTTAGTGSEATPNAIVARPQENLKVGIVRPALLPDHVILDADLTLSLPAAVTAATGIDALCHVTECYTASVANPLSDLVALEGARLILQNITQAYEHPDDKAAREAMLLGAFYGGVAIAASGTNIVHALSYPLGGRYHIPHGIANAVLMVAGLEFNATACQSRFATLARHAGIVGSEVSDGEAVRQFFDHLRSLIRRLNIPARLSDLNIPANAIDALTEGAFAVKRLLNQNPRPVSAADIRAIYERLI